MNNDLYFGLSLKTTLRLQISVIFVYEDDDEKY